MLPSILVWSAALSALSSFRDVVCSDRKNPIHFAMPRSLVLPCRAIRQIRSFHYFKPSNPPAECPPTNLLLATTREPPSSAFPFKSEVNPYWSRTVSIAVWSLSSFSTASISSNSEMSPSFLRQIRNTAPPHYAPHLLCISYGRVPTRLPITPKCDSSGQSFALRLYRRQALVLRVAYVNRNNRRLLLNPAHANRHLLRHLAKHDFNIPLANIVARKYLRVPEPS